MAAGDGGRHGQPWEVVVGVGIAAGVPSGELLSSLQLFN